MLYLLWALAILVAVVEGIPTKGVKIKSFADQHNPPKQRGPKKGGPDNLWRPPGQSREEVLEHRGISKKDYKKYLKTMYDIKVAVARSQGASEHEIGTITADQPYVYDDQMVSPTTSLQILQKINGNQGNGRRRKRKIFMFPQRKWQLPIYYVIDNIFNDAQKALIRKAVSHFQEKTCVTFTEFPVEDANNGNINKKFVIFTDDGSESVYAYLGDDSYFGLYQIINLAREWAFSTLGIAVHEIGHTVGFIHEHQRPDRGSHISFEKKNVVAGQLANFDKFRKKDVFENVNYDYGSVMHYFGWAGNKCGSSQCIVLRTTDSRYQNVLGQEEGLSFYDRVAANKEYCPSSCGSYCSQGGYAESGCTSCVCPEGFAGNTCDAVESGHPECSPLSGEIVVTNTEECVETPGYSTTGIYTIGDDMLCNWHLKAPAGRRVSIRFDGAFGLGCAFGPEDSALCYHWIEVKINSADFSERGIRYCCYTTPSGTVESTSDEMMLIFNARSTLDYRVHNPDSYFGARICYKYI